MRGNMAAVLSLKFYQTDGSYPVRVNGYFQVKGVFIQVDGGSINSRFVQAFGNLAEAHFFLTGSKHVKKYNSQDDSKKKENAGVYNFLHM